VEDRDVRQQEMVLLEQPNPLKRTSPLPVAFHRVPGKDVAQHGGYCQEWHGGIDVSHGAV
jgi:hypothetical protein